MAQLVDSSCFHHGVHEVLRGARPRNPAALREADRIAECTVDNLKTLMGADDADEAVLRDPAAGDESSHEAPGTWGNSPAPDDVRKAFKGLKPLVVANRGFPENRKWNERGMYGCMQALFLFVAHHVKRGLAGSDLRRQARLILPYAEVDANPWHADDERQPDLGLTIRWLGDDVSCVPDKADYADAFAILEAKGERESSARGRDSTLGPATKDAFVQLLDYTRHLYSNQVDRRYAWGLTQCRAEARACFMLHDCVLATHAMDLRSEDGRREFVRLIVDWSTCEYHQLGLDPTIQWLEELGCWEIGVPDERNARSDTGNGDTGGRDAGGDMAPYYFAKSFARGNSLLGSHTRYFMATQVRPARNVKDDPTFNPQMLIKDSWSLMQ
ncbi:hypothetical protein IWQ57_001119 [Coemansia nantahalensis]|uniref:Uncharacterized protein n=1 Tax=Coemansia nantahalensis TaxID=2789366 RepID=A0ACC1K5C8_9FUNG|nr:hypothetical protein IWQ57_001119 [Coemansia nantahalensis]